MKILITGSAGFIGFNFSKFLLTNTNFIIMGIDNFNDYYDVNLKKNRILNKINNIDLFDIYVILIKHDEIKQLIKKLKNKKIIYLFN